MADADSRPDAKLYGYHGNYLWVDVGSGVSKRRPLSKNVLRQFLGGSGLGTYLLLENGAAKVEPLSLESVLTFVFSPLVGSALTTSAKFAVVSRSPLTRMLNDSLASSSFAMDGKKAGSDAIVITGKAAELSILVIDDAEVRVEPAPQLAGLTCTQTETWLKEAFGKTFSFAVIGPAGENQVHYATISHDGRHAGRGGSGAVLGSKNIKAVVVRGTKRTAWAHPAQLTGLAKSLSEKSMGPATAKYRELGTVANLLTFNRLKTLPTRNFQQGSFEQVESLSPQAMEAAHPKTRSSCASCTIGCEHIFSLRKEGDGEEGSQGVRMEYENLFALGPLLGISDPQMVLRASQRCDELGLDTISLGGTIAFAMECVERGLLTEPKELRFGNADLVLKLIEQVARREGFGNDLAEGSKRLAEKVGQGSIAFAAQVKGLELPGYEPRALQTMALGFAVGARGADHNRSGAYEHDFSERVDRRQLSVDAPALAMESEDKAALIDSLILCKFLRGVFVDFYAEAATLYEAVTGMEVTAEELQTTAKRIVTAKKMFNIRCGWQPADDTLPGRFLGESLQDDSAARLTSQALSQGIAAYNLARGWSEVGFPLHETLMGLDLSQL